MPQRTMRTRVLAIEDGCPAASLSWGAVLGAEYEVETTTRGNDLKARIRGFLPHLVVINSEHHQESNAGLCKRLRRYRESARLPILLLTDRAEESVESLDAGADDCLVRPISLRELPLRIHGLLRRARSVSILRVADIMLDLDRVHATRAGRDVHVTSTGFKLLEALMRTPGCPLTRSELISAVWPNTRVDGGTVNAHIKRLRMALTQGKGPDPIVTVRRVGYCLSTAAPKSIVRSRPSLSAAERTSSKPPRPSKRRRTQPRRERHVAA